MSKLFTQSVYFGSVLTIAAFLVGTQLKRRFNKAVFNPLLIAIILVISALLTLKIDYTTYNSGAKYITYLLTPATVCLAVPLYQQFDLLKRNWKAVIGGIAAGTLASMASIFALCLIFGLSHTDYVTLLPKSITTAIGMGVSAELGGYVPVTVTIIVITGVIGNIFAETICRIFKITHPIAKGIGIGTASHAIGTTKAMELGKTEGAMSSLSIVVSGLLTVITANIFANFI